MDAQCLGSGRGLSDLLGATGLRGQSRGSGGELLPSAERHDQLEIREEYADDHRTYVPIRSRIGQLLVLERTLLRMPEHRAETGRDHQVSPYLQAPLDQRLSGFELPGGDADEVRDAGRDPQMRLDRFALPCARTMRVERERPALYDSAAVEVVLDLALE